MGMRRFTHIRVRRLEREVPCPDCNLMGIDPDEQLVCPTCDGAGLVPESWLDEREE
jgi:hypothetical protein